MTGVDPLPRLADALTEVSARLQEITAEVRSLQATTSPPVLHPPLPWVAPTHAYPPYPPHPPRPPMHQAPPPPPYPVAPPPERATVWERLSREGAGSRIIAWVGGAVTLAGVVLLLVLAIQRGYIGPMPRVALGAALGLALGAIALRLHANPDNRVGAHALAATGAAMLYLDAVAATSLYHFVIPAGGLTIALAVAAAGTTVALRWQSPTLATFVVASGAVSAPLLTQNRMLLIGFLLVLHMAASPVVVIRRWNALAVAAAVPASVAVLVDVAANALDHARLTQDAITVGLLCLVVGVVQVVVATGTARGRSGHDEVALGLLLAAPVPVFVDGAVLQRPAAIALVGGLGVLLVAVALLRRGLRLSERYADAAACAALAAAFEVVCVAFHGDVRAIVLLSSATMIALLAGRLRHVPLLAAATVFGTTGVALAFAHSVRPDHLLVAPSGTISRSAVVTAGSTGALIAVAALVVGWTTARIVVARDPATLHTRWTVAAVIGLYGTTAAVLSVGLALAPDAHGFLVGHVLVTVSWTVGALVLLLRHVDSAPLRVAGLALVAAAVAKLVLFDLASLSGIARVLAFLGAGLVLLAAGARYARLVAARRTPAEPS